MIIIFSGPSGVGKSTIINELIKHKNLYFSISHTTREKRHNEIDGSDYFFVSIDEFNNLIDNNFFIEYEKYGTDYYGTGKNQIDESNKITVLDVEVNGASKLLKNNKEFIEVGATTPLTKFESYIQKYYPDFNKILKRYGSVQIRNVATIAGNIATASPIGDNLPLLLALDSKIVLQGIKKSKVISINDFFISYRKTKLKTGQFIHSIRIPIVEKNIFKAYKISKRFDDDISSVCAAFNIKIENKKIKNIKIAYGGMAAIPKRAIYCERSLLNSQITPEIIEKAKNALEKDFSPISDMRASGKYRKIVAKNLLEKCFLEIQEKKLIGIYS